MRISDLIKIDPRPISIARDEILCFVAVKNELVRLPHFLDYYRRLGVHRFIFVDSASNDGTPDFITAQTDSHCYHTNGSYFRENTAPPAWTNALSNTVGHDHWCLTVDADELLTYPHCEELKLRQFCALLEKKEAEGLFCPMIDMYGDGPIADVHYVSGQAFVDACPLFDSGPGKIWSNEGKCPPISMLGGARERVFWQGIAKREPPPCISKIPLIRWRRGMKYLSSMHRHSGVRLSDIQGALLHFKFLTSFERRNSTSLIENEGVIEKGLKERQIYNLALRKNPNLTMKFEGSVRFENSAQLVELGWMKSSPDLEAVFSKTVDERARGRSSKQDQYAFT
jgi:hypothetical protein